MGVVLHPYHGMWSAKAINPNPNPNPNPNITPTFHRHRNIEFLVGVYAPRTAPNFTLREIL
jgi:hypothetical protein